MLKLKKEKLSIISNIMVLLIFVVFLLMSLWFIFTKAIPNWLVDFLRLELNLKIASIIIVIWIARRLPKWFKENKDIKYLVKPLIDIIALFIFPTIATIIFGAVARLVLNSYNFNFIIILIIYLTLILILSKVLNLILVKKLNISFKTMISNLFFLIPLIIFGEMSLLNINIQLIENSATNIERIFFNWYVIITFASYGETLKYFLNDLKEKMFPK